MKQVNSTFSEQINFLVKPEMKDQLMQLANVNDMDLSNYLRWQLKQIINQNKAFIND